jgi:hypothetical protein
LLKDFLVDAGIFQWSRPLIGDAVPPALESPIGLGIVNIIGRRGAPFTHPIKPLLGISQIACVIHFAASGEE